LPAIISSTRWGNIIKTISRPVGIVCVPRGERLKWINKSKQTATRELRSVRSVFGTSAIPNQRMSVVGFVKFAEKTRRVRLEDGRGLSKKLRRAIHDKRRRGMLNRGIVFIRDNTANVTRQLLMDFDWERPTGQTWPPTDFHVFFTREIIRWRPELGNKLC